MKKLFAKALLCTAASLALVAPTFAAPETYTLDSSHSYVMWHINHFGFSNPSGKWMVDGTLILDETKPQNSKVDVTIHMDGLSTGVAKLDEHLKSEDFLDVAKYPTATFVSDKVTMTGKGSAKVHGMLTVHGVSKPVTLDVKLNKLGMSPIANKKTAGFAATAKLKRSDFGISKYLPGLGDDVTINIESEANLNDSVKKTA